MDDNLSVETFFEGAKVLITVGSGRDETFQDVEFCGSIKRNLNHCNLATFVMSKRSFILKPSK